METIFCSYKSRLLEKWEWRIPYLAQLSTQLADVTSDSDLEKTEINVKIKRINLIIASCEWNQPLYE